MPEKRPTSPTVLLEPAPRGIDGRGSRPSTIGSLVMVESGTGKLPSYTQTLPRTPESVRRARQLVYLALNVWGLKGVRDAAELVVSELLTNAVVHARRDSVQVIVTRVSSGRIRVAVVDLSKQRPTPRAAGEDEESGRGLEIVEALSYGKWGVDELPWGKGAWAELGFAEEEPDE